MYKINCENIGDVKKYIWHYRKGNKEYGPLTYEDIVELVSKGEIGPEDYVLKFGYKKFVKAGEIQGLMDAAPAGGEKQPDMETAQEPNEPQEIHTAQDVLEKHDMEPITIKEETRKELQTAFESNVIHMQKHKKNELVKQKLMVAVAVVLGLGLAAWLLVGILR